MNKKLSIIIALFLGLGFFFGSCSDDDDKNQISEEWKEYQKSRITDVMTFKDESGVKVYTALETDLVKGKYVHYRSSEWITNILEGEFGKGGPIVFDPPKEASKAEKKEVIEKLKYDTDIAVLRYHGWYYNLAGNKVIFDTTETDANENQLNNPKDDREFEVGGLVDGFKTVLYDMTVGDERIVCIPHDLGYGVNGNGNIPGYTTLFFDIKLKSIKRNR